MEDPPSDFKGFPPLPPNPSLSSASQTPLISDFPLSNVNLNVQTSNSFGVLSEDNPMDFATTSYKRSRIEEKNSRGSPKNDSPINADDRPSKNRRTLPKTSPSISTTTPNSDASSSSSASSAITLDQNSSSSASSFPPKVTEYPSHSSGPFVIFVEPVDPKLIKGHLHPTTVGRLVAASYQGNIISIASSGSLKVTITLQTREAANRLLIDPSFLKHNLRFSIPSHRLNRQAIIRDVPKDLPDEIILNALSPYGVSKAERLNRRVTAADHSTQLSPSKTVRLSFERQNLPSHILLFFVSYPVSPYVPPTKICFNCFRFGHLSAACRSKAICKKCAKPAHADNEICPRADLQPTCINCNLNHLPTDRSCPEWTFQANLRAFAAERNLLLSEALPILLRSNPPRHNSRSFPPHKFSTVSSSPLSYAQISKQLRPPLNSSSSQPVSPASLPSLLPPIFKSFSQSSVPSQTRNSTPPSTSQRLSLPKQITTSKSPPLSIPSRNPKIPPPLRSPSPPLPNFVDPSHPTPMPPSSPNSVPPLNSSYSPPLSSTSPPSSDSTIQFLFDLIFNTLIPALLSVRPDLAHHTLASCSRLLPNSIPSDYGSYTSS